MNRKIKGIALLIPVFILLGGCAINRSDETAETAESGNAGTTTDTGDDSARSSIQILSISPEVVQSDVVEGTDDYGIDGLPGTGDKGEGDNMPQPGEMVTAPLVEDSVTVIITNTPAEGDSENADIEIYSYAISYHDDNGLTPDYAPSVTYDAQITVPADGSGTAIDVLLVDMAMKTGRIDGEDFIMGLRDIFLYDIDNFNSTLYAQLDFYGRNTLSDDEVFTTGSVEIHFSNYMQ